MRRQFRGGAIIRHRANDAQLSGDAGDLPTSSISAFGVANDGMQVGGLALVARIDCAVDS